ncbi:MAG: bifunctional DNA primase/polymerase [Planctomycetes bacterium]|nr:bifunctional DNA primase/polymerase [Planctomycetota bacterium]
MTADSRAAAELRVREVTDGHKRGWSFTPLNGKKPYLGEWNTAPHPTSDQCVAWAKRGNIGIRTGAASGVIVFDEDTVDGSTARAFGLPRTVTAVTGSGKRHYYLRAPSFRVKNSVKELANDVDIRGDGGQAVFPGSIHPDTGGVYRWEVGLSPSEVEIAEAPPGLLELLAEQTKPRPATARERSDPPARAGKVLDACIRDVATAPEGQRNDALNRAAYTLGGLVANGTVDRAEVEAQLEAAATTAGLASREIAATIRSGLKAGIEQPLQLVEFKPTARRPKSTSKAATSAADDHRPRITLGADEHKILDEIERILGGGETPAVFNRGGVLVHTICIPVDTKQKNVTRPEGLAVVVPIEPHALCDVMNTHIQFIRLRKVGDRCDEYAVPAPLTLARQLIARRQWKAIPSLHGLLAGPVVLQDGAILTKNGYDRASGLYVDLGGLELPAIPERPTLEHARAALDELKKFYSTLPFVSPEDRSVGLAATLTPLSRPCYRNTPLFAASAPTIGTGKSLLCDVVTIIATGRTAPAMSQAKDEDENRKTILALLMESSPVVLIDNCTRPLSGASLCSALTQESLRGRMLGFSATVIVATTQVTFFASGNNFSVEGDLRRRVLVCMMDAKEERPWLRRFKRNLRDIALDSRSGLLAAALTILRWRLRTAVDESPPGLDPFGGFDGWSHVVREALVMLGEPDPVLVMARNDMKDPETADLLGLHTAWRDVVGAERITAAEVAEKAKDHTSLMQALSAIGCVERGQIVNTKRLGKYLGTVTDRRLNGLWIQRLADRSGAGVWRLAGTEVGGNGGFGGMGPSPTREEVDVSSCMGDQQPTHESHESPPGSGAPTAIASPCAACGSTAWWEEQTPGVWVCRACRAPAGAGYAAAAKEGDV